MTPHIQPTVDDDRVRHHSGLLLSFNVLGNGKNAPKPKKRDAFDATLHAIARAQETAQKEF